MTTKRKIYSEKNTSEKKFTIAQYFNMENLTGHSRMKDVFVKKLKGEEDKTLEEWRKLVKKYIK